MSQPKNQYRGLLTKIQGTTTTEAVTAAPQESPAESTTSEHGLSKDDQIVNMSVRVPRWARKIFKKSADQRDMTVEKLILELAEKERQRLIDAGVISS